jgi:hypothetical protein
MLYRLLFLLYCTMLAWIRALRYADDMHNFATAMPRAEGGMHETHWFSAIRANYAIVAHKAMQDFCLWQGAEASARCAG